MQLSNVMHGITWEFNKQRMKNSANSLPFCFEKFSFHFGGKLIKETPIMYVDLISAPPALIPAVPSNLHRFMITLFIRIRGISTIIVWLKQFSSILLCSTDDAEREHIFQLFHVKSGKMRDVTRLRRDKCKFLEYLIVATAEYMKRSEFLIKRNLLFRIVE